MKVAYKDAQQSAERVVNATDVPEELQQLIRDMKEGLALLRGASAEGTGPLPESLQQALGDRGSRGAIAEALHEFRGARSTRKDMAAMPECIKFIERHYYLHRPDAADTIAGAFGSRETDFALAERIMGADVRGGRVLVTSFRFIQILQWLDEVGNAP